MNMVYIANTSPEEKDIIHFGTKGMKWYARYHQSYETKPTRSGKVGSEYGDAANGSYNDEVETRGDITLSKEEMKELKRLEKQGVKYEKWKQKKLSNDKFVRKHFGELTNEELAYHIERKQLEAKMNELKESKKQGRWSTISKAMDAVGGGAVAFSKAAAAVTDIYNTYDNIKKKGKREGPTPSNVNNYDQKWRVEENRKRDENKFRQQMEIENFKRGIEKDDQDLAYKKWEHETRLANDLKKSQQDLEYNRWQHETRLKNELEKEVIKGKYGYKKEKDKKKNKN